MHYVSKLPPPLSQSNETISSHLTGVDLFKYLMAYCIVAIHFKSHYGHDLQYPFLIHWIINLGVPFFFIVNGFLIQRKIELLDKKSQKLFIKKRFIKVLRIWLCWLLFYLPLTLYTYWNQGLNFFLAIKSYIIQTFFFGWTPWAGPLWYLGSLTTFLVILYITLNFKNYKEILLFIFIILTLIYWYIERFEITNWLHYFIYSKKLLGGGIYISMGIFLYKKNIKMHWCLNLLFFVTSIVLLQLNYPLPFLFGGILIFNLARRLNFKNNNVFLDCRYQSMWIYYLHEYVCFFYFIIINIGVYEIAPISCYLMIAITCGIIAFVMNRIQKMPKFSLISFLVK